MAVVAIARHYAAGGSAVAAEVAAALGWQLIDNELIDRVAERAGVSPKEAAERLEAPPSLIERLANTLAASSPEVFLAAASEPLEPLEAGRSMVRITEAVIDEAVRGDDTVIVGRGAHAYLAERQATLHVFVTAPREARIRAARERLNVSPAEAAKAVDDKDRQREKYARLYYSRDWTDPSHYHLVVNTERLGFGGAARAIVAAAHAQLAID